ARIEVANSLLFTLPGSPVVYYGDEIGMGDNIWMEDRDGVRTPMQWSDGRNAGFSSADPDDIYPPVIDDERYGYEQVNVARQRDDPGSLLNWMRHAIEVRHEHPTLARGDLRFLDARTADGRAVDNAVLAYLRAHEGEHLLVVNNLSPEPRTVTLDLEGYAGAQPVDILHGEAAPAIGQDPYQLALARYGYRWLKL
ncbi:MAG: alpha-glucosidase C-terminal domain-containing protein, partial [Anaerolineae bacterium]